MLLQKKNDFAYREGSQAAFLVFKHFSSLYQHDTNLCLNSACPHHINIQEHMHVILWRNSYTVFVSIGLFHEE